MTTIELESRLSKNHRLLHEIVQEQGPGRHLSMADLYEIARTRRPGIGFTTVYRALTRLRDVGLVSELSLPGADSAYYETARSPHAHFRCLTCGSVTDVPYQLPEDVQSRLASTLHAEVTGSDVSLHGRCAACAAKVNGSASVG
jgi:Fur family transcriptional regulator, ferric uptake regulator